MEKLTKKLHILNNNNEEELVTLYKNSTDVGEPNLKLTVDNIACYTPLGDITSENATSLRVYRTSDDSTLAVLKGVILDDYIALISRDIESLSNEDVTSIGDSNVFYMCTSLTTIDLPNVTSIGSSAFFGCTSLTNTNIPNVESIGDRAFYSCTSLTTIDLPNVTSISGSAFYNCKSLTTVNLPNVTSISGSAFYSCTSLKTVDLPNVTSISYNAFQSCTSLTSIDLPNVTSISSSAFAYCTSLTNTNIPNVTSISDRVFYNCTSLTSIDLPNVTSIGDYAFYNCKSLTSIDLPNVTSIGNSAFRTCTSLKTVDLPNVTSIGSSAFYGCTSLTTIDLPNATSIGSSAFYGCTSLTTIDLPNATSIGDYAFSDCTKLTAIHFSAANKSKIVALDGYSNKFRATNATIYFDLNAAKLYFSNFDTDATYSINGEVLTSNDGYILIPNDEYTLIISKSGYLTHFETISTSGTYDITKDITLLPNTDSSASTCNINISYEATDTEPTITTTFSYNGYTISTVEGTSPSITVPLNSVIDYTIKAKGYKSIKGTLTANAATVNINYTLEATTATTYNLSYPFTDNAEVLANLVDDANFTIAETPTANSGSGIASSIINGTNSFKVNSGKSYGYIKFHTPDTDDTEQLTVSVTCNAYAERNYDVGAVFIDTAQHAVTTNYRFTGGSGKTDSSYGYVLYSSYGKASATYNTYTYTLQPNTEYYLQFAYTKDGSGNSNWDRFSITNIKFTDDGSTQY